MTSQPEITARLLIICPDRKGLVAAIAQFLLDHHANIIHSDQHQDAESDLFLMRLEWDMNGFDIERKDFAQAFEAIATRFKMRWKLTFSDERPRLGILVSQFDHCLADLLYRHRSGELQCDIPLIISNHETNRELAQFYNIPYFFIPTPDVSEKPKFEKKQCELLKEHSVDVIALARYMQILSADFVSQYPSQIINIHHSFLPAFLGAKPYHRAHERGVKLIGATSHYVTETLDDGPIIEQDVIRISHRDAVKDLIQKGRDLEKITFSRAIRWHLESRILVYGNKTVVFD